jgi:hypothetical protein
METHAQKTLAILNSDANTRLLFVMTTTLALMILVTTRKDVSLRLTSVMTATLALMTLVILTRDVFSNQEFALTTTPAPKTLAMRRVENSNMNLKIAMMEIHAPKTLVIQ